MIAIALGTLPEITKMSPFIQTCGTLGIEYFTLHIGQHYSYKIERAFFEDLKLPQQKYNLYVASDTHAEQIGKIINGIYKILFKEKIRFPSLRGIQTQSLQVLLPRRNFTSGSVMWKQIPGVLTSERTIQIILERCL